jgi:hypothetical protein
LQRQSAFQIFRARLHRDFIDPENRYWQVWFVLPTAASRRDEAPGAVSVPRGYEGGWLCFERDDSLKRRLVPAPESWETATVAQLWEWCQQATPVQRID